MTGATDAYYGVRINPTLTLSPRTYYGIYVPARSDALTNNIGLQIDQPTVGATRAAAISIGTPGTGTTYALYAGSTNMSYFGGELRAASAFSAIGPTSLGTTVAATTANLTIGGVPATDAAGGHEGVYIFETVTNALDTYYGVRVNPTLTLSPRTYYGAYIPARSDALTNNIGLQVDQPTVGATRATAISIGTPAGGSWSFYNGSTNPSYFAGPIDLGNSDTTLARSAAGVVTIEGVKIATQPTTETLTYSGGTNVTITAGKGPNQRSLLTVTNNFQLLWSGLTDNDSGAVHLIPATTNVTVLVSSPGRAAGSSAATATGSTTLTITGATNGWAELAWSVVSVGGTNRVSVNLGAY
jgi:hypothetical protein